MDYTNFDELNKELNEETNLLTQPAPPTPIQKPTPPTPIQKPTQPAPPKPQTRITNNYFQDININGHEIEFVNTIPILDPKPSKTKNYSPPIEGYQLHTCDDICMKVILIGDSFTGKTSFINVIKNNIPNANYTSTSRSTSTSTSNPNSALQLPYISTVGVDMCKVTLINNKTNKQIGVQLWDTAGQERFMSIMSAYYKNTCLALIFFDINNYESYLRAKGYWYEKAIEGGNIVCLVGNKFDTEDKTRRVPDTEIREFVRKNRVYYIENDNRTNNGEIAKNNFKYLIAEIIKNKDKMKLKQGISYPKKDYGSIDGVINLNSSDNNNNSNHTRCCIIC